ncbi:MAG: DUF262 domain-containing protein [Lachnospiraceae bacterium]|nr:DUF262 domain-containing protein [Lachnospiraceae bacterium]
MNLTEIFVNKLKIESKVVTIDSLFNEAKVKRTQYAPPYQRNYVWDGEKATYFLESILIGTEIPPLIFFRSKGSVEIIDGRQRYETILKFLRGELRLSKAGLKKLDILNIGKKTFASLPEVLKNDFLDTKLRVIEFSFASLDGITQIEEDSVKQEIFKRYNSGITPLKNTEIDKAIYFDDDLNDYFRVKLHDKKIQDQFDRLFKYEDKKIEVSLQKIRQLLVIHKIPIKYYSKAKQKITDKYYDLLSARITNDQFDKLFDSFIKKLDLLDEVRNFVDTEDFPYNRLISEVLFWAFSILEDNNIILPQKCSVELEMFSQYIKNNIVAFEMDRSSFYNQIMNRYGIIANYLEEKYLINKNIYIETDDTFKQKNRELSQVRENRTTNYQELRINKPEPSTYTIDDICRLMGRSRFLVRPPYQREEVINRKKSSEIIESLLLGIKLPPIFIFKNKEGVSEVIDGQQRILSILAFLGREYMNEKGEKVKSNKDKFSLQLKDSILTGLQGKYFTQLDEEQQEKITGFDLWIIEINERNNPEFEPLDLFIRLNNKPYPIKDDTFEMWNSYIDRSLIDTIKLSYNNCSGWFFMRKMSNRMDNENNYTVLSYFNYLEQNQLDATDKGPLDIYRIGSRIAFRLRSKGEISKILENVEKKESFIEAVNNLEFSFIKNLKTLLSDEKDSSDKTLSKNLDEMLGVENYKRTQQSFYALWYFLKGLDYNNFKNNRKDIRNSVRQLLNYMSSDISLDEFNHQVEEFRLKFAKEGRKKILWGSIEDLMTIYSFDSESSEGVICDIYVKRNNKTKSRLEIMFEKPEKVNEFIGLQIKREGFTTGYIGTVLHSNYIFKEYDFANRNVTTGSIKTIDIPILPLEIQKTFDKIMIYTLSDEYIYSSFFKNILDRMVEEIYHHDLFEFQNVSLFKEVRNIVDLSKFDSQLRNEQIKEIYNSIISDKDGLLAELSAATGITRSYNDL